MPRLPLVLAPFAISIHRNGRGVFQVGNAEEIALQRYSG